jgi:hypothetical protein
MTGTGLYTSIDGYPSIDRRRVLYLLMLGSTDNPGRWLMARAALVGVGGITGVLECFIMT